MPTTSNHNDNLLFGRCVDDFLLQDGFFYTEHQCITFDDSYVILIDVPGFENQELKLSIEKDLLVLRGYRMEVNAKHWWNKSIEHLVFQRSFVYPEDISANTIKAEYTTGSVEIKLPRQKIFSSRDPRYLNSYYHIKIRKKEKNTFWNRFLDFIADFFR